MQLLRVTILSLLACALSLAADINGTWIGNVDTNDGAVRLTIDLKAEGDTLTGSVTSHVGKMTIREGKISGDELSWVTVYERDGNSLRILNKAKVSGSEMKVVTTVEGRDDRFEYTAKKSS